MPGGIAAHHLRVYAPVHAILTLMIELLTGKATQPDTPQRPKNQGS
jgi:hypothetical protein